MKIEDQCVSLEYAQRLKELGVKQESLFYWCPSGFNADTGEWQYHLQFIIKQADDYNAERVYSAFTVAELMSLIPPFMKCDRFYRDWSFNLAIDGYMMGIDVEVENEPNPVYAYAKVLIHLLENKLIKL